MKYLSYTLAFIAFFSCSPSSDQLNYPKTEKIPVVDTYFDEEVIDNYRWLEDDNSKETKEWVTEQNEVTFSYLEKIPFRSQLKERLGSLWNYEKLSAPFEEGPYTYYYKNDGLQNQFVVYRKGEDGQEELFLDPNTFSEDGTTSLAGLSFSKSGKLAAYSISVDGSDWRKIIVLDAIENKIIEDTLVDVKFSGIEWKKEEGFFYSSYDKPKGSELSEMTDQHKLYYHKLGTPQSEDELIFGGTEEEKHRYVGASVTEDGRYLFVSASKTTSGNVSFLKDLDRPNSPLAAVDEDYSTDSYLLESEGPTFFIVTNKEAPNQKLVKATAKHPNEEHWTDVIPETENVLSVSSGGGYIFARYMIDAITQVVQYNFKAKNDRLSGRNSKRVER